MIAGQGLPNRRWNPGKPGTPRESDGVSDHSLMFRDSRLPLGIPVWSATARVSN